MHPAVPNSSPKAPSLFWKVWDASIHYALEVNAESFLFLQHIAQLLLSESDTYSHMLQDALKKGHSFPAARHQALEKLTGDASVSQILSEPNNILGIEYLKALKKQNSRMVPYTLKRDSSGYHDTKLTATVKFRLCHSECPETLGEQPFSRYPADPQQTPDGFSELLQNQLPENALRLLRDAWNQSCPIETNDFSLLLKYRLLCETRRSLCEYQDISEDLANRIIRNRNQKAGKDFQFICPVGQYQHSRGIIIEKCFFLYNSRSPNIPLFSI
mgnify:CR=1 FL=1